MHLVAHFIFSFFKQRALLEKVCFRFENLKSMLTCRVCTYSWKHYIDAKCNTILRSGRFCPELSYRPDWWPKRCPIFVYICYDMVYIWYIWYCTHTRYFITADRMDISASWGWRDELGATDQKAIGNGWYIHIWYIYTFIRGPTFLQGHTLFTASRNHRINMDHEIKEFTMVLVITPMSGGQY